MEKEEDNLEFEATQRGFSYANFKDSKGVECSIQESSLVTPSIWLGCNNLDIQAFRKGDGWQPVDIQEVYPCEYFVGNNRMHLNQDQVAALIPILQHFVETGELPN